MGVQTANDAPIRKRAKVAPLTEEQRKSAKADRLAIDQKYKARLDDAFNTMSDLVESIADEYGKSSERVFEDLSLGGRVLKDRRRPGINNAWAHCQACTENGACEFYFGTSSIYPRLRFPL